MICPLCNLNLKEKKFKNIYGQNETSYQCLQCGGIFFPSLSGLKIEEKEADKLEEINLPLLRTKFPLDTERNFKCPQCNKKMGKYLNPKYENILILFCENCKGMFFNHGELLKFVRKKKETILKYKEKEEEKYREKELLRKIYESQGKEALIQTIRTLYKDKEEIKKEYEEELISFFLKTLLEFLMPFSKLKANIILNILLTLIPFIRDTIKKNEKTL